MLIALAAMRFRAGVLPPIHKFSDFSSIWIQSGRSLGSSRMASSLELANVAIAVVGGGIAGSVCASQLAIHGFRVSLFDMGRGLGGRISQRREKRDDGLYFLFDHGAPYFTASIPRVQKFIETMKEDSVVEEWKGKFGTFDCSSLHFSDDAKNEAKFVGVPGMNAICESVVKKQNIHLNLSTEISAINQRLDDAKNPKWNLVSKSGQTFENFDIIVVAAAYRTFQIVSDPIVDVLNTLKTNDSFPCFAVMLAFARPLTEIPYDGIKVQNSQILSLLARDSSKPKRRQNIYVNQSMEEGPECWVLHSTASFAQDIVKGLPPGRPSPETLNQVAKTMLSEFQKLSPEIPPPIFIRAHRWGGAFPKRNVLGVDGPSFWFDPRIGLAVCGDFCSGPTVESAVDSALQTSEAIRDSFK